MTTPEQRRFHTESRQRQARVYNAFVAAAVDAGRMKHSRDTVGLMELIDRIETDRDTIVLVNLDEYICSHDDRIKEVE